MKFNAIKKIIFLYIAVFTVIFSVMSVNAESVLILTQEEQDYINGKEVLMAVSVDETAPIQYYDENGEVKGISKEILETISKMTGLNFSYKLYKSVDEAKNSGGDIFFGVPYNPSYTTLSIPYFKTETILYINSSVNPQELDDKKYAAVKGVQLPKGIKEENVVYFNTREACLDAVERGKVDYGYANAFSVAYYIVRNNYKNVITVPEKMETREYCIAFLNDDEVLRSIINKAILNIDESHLSTLVLNAATQMNVKISISMIMKAYGTYIFGGFLLIIVVLSISFYLNVKAKNEIRIQYERYQMLSKTSNEYLYEYHVKTNQLELSNNCIELFGSTNNLSELKAAFNKALINRENTIPAIELPFANGEKRFFKSVNSFLYDDKARIYSIIGKLIDINEEETEKKELIKKSEIDGLTGIYNAVTTKNLITDSINNADSDLKYALIVLDYDKFKEINDTDGHLQGDKVIANISRALKQTFRKTDIIGRIGGDEFCVYMQDVPSVDFAVSKCQQLMDLILELNKENHVTVSIGISLLGEEKSYDELFKKVDDALYEAKKKGGNRIQFYE